MENKMDLRILFAGCYSFFAMWLLTIAQPSALYQVLALVFVIASIPFILTSTTTSRKESRLNEESMHYNIEMSDGVHSYVISKKNAKKEQEQILASLLKEAQLRRVKRMR